MENKTTIKRLTYILCLIGLILIYSASNIVCLDKYNDSFYYLKRQAIFFFIGLFLMKITSGIDYHILLKKANNVLIISSILLVLVLIPGIGIVRGGSQSWFSLGPISFQPSELFKVSIILFLSNYLKTHYPNTKKLKTILPPLIITLLGFALIMLQPDFGSGFVMIASSISLIFISALPIKYFVYMGILGMIGAIGLIVVAPYRLVRILSFLDPFSDPLGSGFQAIQALYAIGPGGLLGVGFNQSIQKHFYLPEPQTDFIFAIFAEEFGLIGSLVLLFIFGYFFYTCFKVAFKSQDQEGFYLAFGLTSLLCIQTIVNLCVVTGLFPVTGVTLPLISYGGTSLVITMMCIGIIINVSKK